MRKRAGNLGRTPRRAPHPDLGPIVTGAREASGLTVPQLAGLIGVSDRFVQYLQVNDRCPSAVMADRLEAALGVPIPMAAIDPAELSIGSRNRTARRLRKAQQERDAAWIAAPPPAPPVYDGPRIVNGWGRGW